MKLVQLLALGILAAVMAAPAAAAAANQAGTVASISGRGELGRGGAWLPLGKGDPVYVGDQVRTGADGRVHLQMVDKSVITVSASSRLEVTAYLFKQGGERKSLLRLWTGKLRAVVSKYSGTAANEYRLSTPTAVAGVRGTDLVLDIHPADPDAVPEQSPSENPEGYATTLAVLEGEVAFQNILEGIAGEVIVSGGSLSRVSHGSAPDAVRGMNAQEQNRYRSASFAPRGNGPQFAGGGEGGQRTAGAGEGGDAGGAGNSEEGAGETQESGDSETVGEQGSELGSTLGDTFTPSTPPINQQPGTVDGLVPVTVEIRRVD